MCWKRIPKYFRPASTLVAVWAQTMHRRTGTKNYSFIYSVLLFYKYKCSHVGLVHASTLDELEI
jgi:hypothetical protein